MAYDLHNFTTWITAESHLCAASEFLKTNGEISVNVPENLITAESVAKNQA